MPTLNAPWGTDADLVDAVPKLFSKDASEDKENVLAKMPSIFGKEGDDRKDFSRPPSAATNQRFSGNVSQMMRKGNKARGLASRPTTANNTMQTRSTTSMSGGKIVERHGEKFCMINQYKATGYKKFPKQEAPQFTSTTMASFVDPSPSLRGKKKLEPYRPESARSRLPVRFKGEPKPHTRHCQPSNISQFSIGTVDPNWETWKKKVTRKRQRPVSAQ